MTVRHNAADIVSLFKCEHLYMLGAQVIDQHLKLQDAKLLNANFKHIIFSLLISLSINSFVGCRWTLTLEKKSLA